jgi:TRAP transporter TAXI family solute receptor
MKLASIIALLGVLLVAGMPSDAAAQGKTALVFAAGPTGGNWTPLAVATAEIVRKRFPDVDVQVEPGTAQANIEKLMTDRADLGWSTTTTFFDARTGKGRWKDRPGDKLFYVASYYPTIWHLAVPANSGITKVSDLKGKNVALPQRASASMEAFELVLNLHGVKLEDLGTRSYGSFVENAEAIKNRQAVAMGWLVTAPAPFMLDLGASMKLRLIPVSDEMIEKARKVNGGYVRHVIRKGTYSAVGIDEDVVTMQAPTILMASSRAPADAIYKMAKAIVEGREAFGPVSAVMKGVRPADFAHDIGFPYHPGAERYYREAGLLK